LRAKRSPQKKLFPINGIRRSAHRGDIGANPPMSQLLQIWLAREKRIFGGSERRSAFIHAE
jgi:hypothetical protein